MTEIERLEAYFDKLTEDASYASEHPLADDKARAEFYVGLKGDMARFGNGLEDLAGLKDADLDSCIRAVAVETVLGQPPESMIAALVGKEEEEAWLAVEQGLQEARAGIMAKDKRMMEVLRQVRLETGEPLVGLAMRKIREKSGSVKDIIAKGKRDVGKKR